MINGNQRWSLAYNALREFVTVKIDYLEVTAIRGKRCLLMHVVFFKAYEQAFIRDVKMKKGILIALFSSQ